MRIKCTEEIPVYSKQNIGAQYRSIGTGHNSMVKKVDSHLDMYSSAIPLATACTGLILHAIYQQSAQILSAELIWLLDGDRAEFRQASSQEP